MGRLLALRVPRIASLALLVASGLILSADSLIERGSASSDGVAPDAAVVALDPETGRPRAATPEELRRFSEEIEESMRRARELPPRVVELPGGGVRVDVGERFMQMSVATIGKDGSLRVSSVDDAEDARALRAAPRVQEVR